jgi:hypothetical protein
MSDRYTKEKASAKAYLGNESFDLIVDMCLLHPNDSWMEWRDAEGNRLRLTKNRMGVVCPAKTVLYQTGDILRKSKPGQIMKHSYWMAGFFSSSKSVLVFLGNDGLLRSSLFGSSWLYNFSPLLLGYVILNMVTVSYLENEARELNSLSLKHIPILEQDIFNEVFVSGVPVEDDYLKRKLKCLQMINQDSTAE